MVFFIDLFKSKKKLIIGVALLIILGFFTKTLSMQHYQELDFSTGIVTASVLNVRQGPSSTYKVITKINKNEYVRVFAQIGNWYVIQTNNDFIGAASVDYIRPVKDNAETVAPIVPTNNEQQTIPEKVTPEVTEVVTDELTVDEKEVLDLINAEREKVGLKALTIDKEVQNVARLKAKDMVDNNYFSHTSPKYNSPFDMLKNFKVSYRTAGENIAGNSSNVAAVNAWMNSEGHKENILNTAYNYTGIAVIKSPVYGKIFVQMFIGR